MKVLVTGARGQLGHDVVNEMIRRGHECVASDIMPEAGVSDGSAGSAAYAALDITDRGSVMRTVTDINPDVIVHCAAWTAVDAAEDPANRPVVYAINVEGTRNIAEAAKETGAKMIYLSTDYVFDGQGEDPWEPDDRSYAPLNYYGETKLQGELAVSGMLDKFFIVRTAWVFGSHGSNFVQAMLGAGRKAMEDPAVTIRVVSDQIGTPTYCHDLARLLADMAETDKFGYYHATNEGGFISWYDFACEIFRQAGIDAEVTAVTTEEYGLSAAERPRNSRLDKSKLSAAGFTNLPPWQDALLRYLKEASQMK